MLAQNAFEPPGLLLGFRVMLLELRLHLGIVFETFGLPLRQLDRRHFQRVHVAQAGMVVFVQVIAVGVTVHVLFPLVNWMPQRGAPSLGSEPTAKLVCKWSFGNLQKRYAKGRFGP